MTPEEVIREFCAAVSKRDPEVLRPLLDQTAIYQNVGMEASRGIEAVIENVAGQWAMFPEAYEFDIVNLATSGSVVLTERIDRVGLGGGAPVAPVPVMGRFEVLSGKITAWYDYFDTALVGKMLAGESVDGLTPS
jgi:limonene-1,2-epoxide hydrolase